MTDISKCDYKECERKDTCLRFMKNAEEYQKYRVDFNKICGSNENNYKYFIQKDVQITETK